MNNRRLSFGLMAILAAAFIGCGEDPPAATPAQPSATADATAAPTQAEAPPPAPTQTAEPAPPPPPPKQAKEKFTGKFSQDFSGEVKDNADAAAKKAAGAKDKDGKKYNAAMDKAKAAFDANQSNVEVTADAFTWNLKGKALHTVTYKIAKGDENTLTLTLGKDGKKDLKGAELGITFKDDSTFEMKDPFSKKPLTLVFKK
jgi:type IV secretory pathway VirB10-like protein